jgi:hypothetical protein
MEPLSPVDLRLDPNLVGILQARARRARAQALHNGVLRLAAAIRDRFAGRNATRLPLRAHWG